MIGVFDWTTRLSVGAIVLSFPLGLIGAAFVAELAEKRRERSTDLRRRDAAWAAQNRLGNVSSPARVRRDPSSLPRDRGSS